MLRRNPTRIEVKLDDLEEFNQMKKDKELEQAKSLRSVLLVEETGVP
jgi:hypothetical protein